MSREYFLKKEVKNKDHRLLLLCLLSLFVFSLVSLYYGSEVYAGQATLSWVAPSTNEDGTPLTDLAGYKIYYGTASGIYTQNVDTGNVTTYTFNSLSDGQTYYFVATAYNLARFESSYSNEISKIIPVSTQTFTLSVSKAGSGTVSSSPAGITCGSDCSESYNSGASITLTATPDASSTFTGWSGACTGSGTCSVTMNGAKNVTATFNLKTYTITASAGNGGSISPSGTIVNYGGSQSFTITPDTNYTVGNVVVDGVSAGSVSTYNFANVSANHTISASFTAVQQNSLNVTKSGTGTGVVTSSPAGITCGSDCTELYTPSAVVTLAATPDSGSTFGGWSGACTGSGTCTLTMDAAKSVSPLFQTNSLTITASAGNGGGISPSGTVTVNYGGSQNFTITPDANYTIGNVVVDGVSAGSVTTYNFANINANHTISASFAKNDNTANPRTKLPKTGQKMTYAMGDDGNIQAGIEWPAQRFAENGDGTLTDNLTGLMWLKDGGCMKAKGKSTITAVAGLNNHQVQNNCTGYTGNYSDWRLPTVNELKSLVNYGAPDSAQWLNSEGFLNMQSTYYWSATSYLGTATKTWMITLINGVEKIGSSNTGYILPVRIVNSDSLPKTGQTVIYNPADETYIQEKIEWPAPRFTDNGDGTVMDSLTGLMWLKDAGCLKNRWNDSLNIIVDFNTNAQRYACSGYSANYNDWRMPNVKELESMINYDVSNAAGWLNSAGFTNVKYSSYWSSTTSRKSASLAWMMNMKKSGKLLQNKKSTFYAWPVRGGNVN